MKSGPARALLNLCKYFGRVKASIPLTGVLRSAVLYIYSSRIDLPTNKPDILTQGTKTQPLCLPNTILIILPFNGAKHAWPVFMLE